MRYLTVRCDGPGCEQEASRLYSVVRAGLPDAASDAADTPGRWHSLTFEGMEDMHFCGYPCLAQWAAEQKAPLCGAMALGPCDIAERPTMVMPAVPSADDDDNTESADEPDAAAAADDQ